MLWRIGLLILVLALALAVALGGKPAFAQTTSTPPWLQTTPEGTWVLQGRDGITKAPFPEGLRDRLEATINRTATIVEPKTGAVWTGGAATNTTAADLADPYQAEGRALRARANALPGANGSKVRRGLRRIAEKAGALKPFRALGTVGLVAGTFEAGWWIGTEAKAALGAKGDTGPIGPAAETQLQPVSTGDVLIDNSAEAGQVLAPSDGFVVTGGSVSTAFEYPQYDCDGNRPPNDPLPTGIVLKDAGTTFECGTAQGGPTLKYKRAQRVGFVPADPTVYPDPSTVPAPGTFTVEGPNTAHVGTPAPDVQHTTIRTTTTQSDLPEEVRVAYDWVASQPESGLDPASRTDDPTAEPAPEPTPTPTATPDGSGTSDPGLAPDGAAACGLTPPSQPFDLSPITAAGLGSKVPFSLVSFVGSGVAGVGGDAARPNASFRLLGATADLSWLANLDPLVGRIRLILTVLLWLGVAWFLYGKTIGRGGA